MICVHNLYRSVINTLTPWGGKCEVMLICVGAGNECIDKSFLCERNNKEQVNLDKRLSADGRLFLSNGGSFCEPTGRSYDLRVYGQKAGT